MALVGRYRLPSFDSLGVEVGLLPLPTCPPLVTGLAMLVASRATVGLGLDFVAWASGPGRGFARRRFARPI